MSALGIGCMPMIVDGKIVYGEVSERAAISTIHEGIDLGISFSTLPWRFLPIPLFPIGTVRGTQASNLLPVVRGTLSQNLFPNAFPETDNRRRRNAEVATFESGAFWEREGHDEQSRLTTAAIATHDLTLSRAF